VLEDTGPKLKSFRDCNPKQRYDTTSDTCHEV
jgi:hypothetical protein